MEDMKTTGIIKGSITNNPLTRGDQKSNNLVTSLKTSIKELKQELQFKIDELFAIKKNIKCTKLSELEIERKQFKDETVRLKSLLDQALKQNLQGLMQEQEYSSLEKKYYQQNSVI